MNKTELINAVAEKAELSKKDAEGIERTGIIETTLGRLIFNLPIPQDLGFVDRSKKENFFVNEIEFVTTKDELSLIVDRCIKYHGNAVTCEVLDKLKAMDCQCRMLFLEASPETVIKRYKETRRRHPLRDGADSLEEAVRQERALMQPVKDRADYVVDTSRLSTAQLRSELLRLFDTRGEKAGMTVNVTSFGFKYGLPMEADLVMDVRFMPNPYYIEALRPKTGLDRDVYEYVFKFQQTKDFMKRLEDLLTFVLPLYAEEGKTSLTLAVGCTGGHHRSVAVTHALTEFIHQQGYPVTENHRDLARGV